MCSTCDMSSCVFLCVYMLECVMRIWLFVCMCVCARARVCVCVCERARKRACENKKARKRDC